MQPFKMASVLKLLVKCGVAGGILYGAASLNVFSSQDRAITSLREMKKTANEYVNVEVPFEVPSKKSVRDKWNNGVQTVFSYVEVAPDKVVDASITGFEETKNFIIKQLNDNDKK